MFFVKLFKKAFNLFPLDFSKSGKFDFIYVGATGKTYTEDIKSYIKEKFVRLHLHLL